MDGWLRSTDAAQHSPINRKSIRAPVNFRNSPNRFRRVSGSAFSPQHLPCLLRFVLSPIVAIYRHRRKLLRGGQERCECQIASSSSSVAKDLRHRTSSHLARNNRIHFRDLNLFRKVSKEPRTSLIVDTLDSTLTFAKLLYRLLDI